MLNLKRRKMIREFYNEIGNEISISIEQTSDINDKKKKRFDALKIIIEGPNSIAEIL